MEAAWTLQITLSCAESAVSFTISEQQSHSSYHTTSCLQYEHDQKARASVMSIQVAQPEAMSPWTC